MARHHRHLESGGPVPTRTDDLKHEFVVPADIRQQDLVREIGDRLHTRRNSRAESRNGATPTLKMTSDGRAVVPAELLLLLGDGSADRGRRVIEEIVKELRNHRMLDRLPVRSLLPARR